MDGSALLQVVAFMAVIVMVLLTVWIVLMLESGGRRPLAGNSYLAGWAMVSITAVVARISTSFSPGATSTP